MTKFAKIAPNWTSGHQVVHGDQNVSLGPNNLCDETESHRVKKIFVTI